MYELDTADFRTPRGRSARMTYRLESSDWNTLTSCMTEDEYRLRELRLEGTALDVGAHLGGVTIGLLLDNPDLRVVAIEAVPPNAELLRRNIEQNGVADRATVLEAAAGKGKTTTIRWAFEGNATADHHAFIGNSLLPPQTKHRSEQVPVRTLAGIVKEFGPLAFAKVDCEGCEFPFLQGPGLADVALIRGEVHDAPEPLLATLKATHDTTVTGTVPAAFEAVLR
jgi:FkbM family methyltransferase